MASCIDVAIGIIVRNAKILICRRREDSPLGGYWEFPGGKCEPGEPPVGCVRRELMEELGVEVEPEEPLPIIEHDYPTTRVRLHPFCCRLERGEPVPLAATEVRWISRHDLSHYRFPPANLALIETLADRLA